MDGLCPRFVLIQPMGFPSYRGPVTTVHHVLMKHAALVIRCQECRHATRRSAYRLWLKHPDIWKLPLEKPVPGFKCTRCRRSVLVVLTSGVS